MKTIYAIAALTLAFATPAFAAAPQWDMNPEKSRITFKVVQNHAPVQGSFDKFTTDIRFDPADLASSAVKATIDTGSVNVAYEEVAQNVKTQDWLAVDMFPKALFESTRITHLEGDRYEAQGTLTLRDHTAPVTLPFTLAIANDKATMEGILTLQRTEFGVGQGEWKNTSIVEDPVVVTVHIEAKRR